MKVTLDRLRELFDYNQKTGIFVRKVRCGHFKHGTVAGTPTEKGYIRINIDGKHYYAHRLAWFYVRGRWPKGDIDHREMVKNDNRFSELRAATRAQNMQNSLAKSNNKSGFKGVSWSKHANKWRATIQINGKWKFLGYFDSAQAAHSAYRAKAEEHFGEFARAA